MIQTLSAVISVDKVGPNLYVATFHAPEIALSSLPGQFINIRVSDLFHPLLRRPFSIYRIHGPEVQIIFNVVGIGTQLIAAKKGGETVDLLGPLGRPYRIDDPFETAVLAGGGLGVAPLPMLTNALSAGGKHSIVTFLGARTSDQIVSAHLRNVDIATDDGSMGFHGTVIDLLRRRIMERRFTQPKIFGCGPSAMLKSLSLLAADFSIPCELSLESAMACGIGICQGCPVETTHGEKKYSLICREGPVFDSRMVRIP